MGDTFKSLPENLKGSFGASFGVGLRWLGPYSPLRGCAGLAALATAKIHCRRPTFNSQTGSEAGKPPPTSECTALWDGDKYKETKKEATHGYVICRCPRPLQIHKQIRSTLVLLVNGGECAAGRIAPGALVVKHL